MWGLVMERESMGSGEADGVVIPPPDKEEVVMSHLQKSGWIRCDPTLSGF